MALTRDEFLGRKAIANWIDMEGALSQEDHKVAEVWQARLQELVDDLGEFLRKLKGEGSAEYKEELKDDFYWTVEEMKTLLDLD